MSCHVSTLTQSDAAKASNFTARIFINGEAMSSTCQRDFEPYHKFFQAVVQQSIAEKNGYVARNEKEVVIAVLLAVDITAPEDNLGLEHCPKDILEVLGATTHLYQSKREEFLFEIMAHKFGTVLHVFMVAVDSKCSGKGIGTQVMRHALKDAKNRGYKVAIAECTCAAMQHMFEGKLQFERVGIVPYANYDAFQSIADTHDGAVVKKQLVDVIAA